MPWMRNEATPAMFMQMRFIKKSENAPTASSNSPFPKRRPKLTKAGSSATATITPINADDTVVVIAIDPAIPDTIARSKSPRLILIRDCIAVVEGST